MLRFVFILVLDNAEFLHAVGSSLVADTLIESYKSVPTIHFYCNYGESERRETLSIIKSLLKQLSMRFEKLDPNMVSYFDNATSLTAKSSEILFTAALSRFDKVFIIVDALDECCEGERESIVASLTRQLKIEGCHVKIFLTSRPENDLRRLLKDSHNYHIDTNDTLKDITPFVAAAVADYIKSGKLLGGEVTPVLKEDLIKTISSEAEGM